MAVHGFDLAHETLPNRQRPIDPEGDLPVSGLLGEGDGLAGVLARLVEVSKPGVEDHQLTTDAGQQARVSHGLGDRQRRLHLLTGFVGTPLRLECDALVKMEAGFDGPIGPRLRVLQPSGVPLHRLLEPAREVCGLSDPSVEVGRARAVLALDGELQGGLPMVRGASVLAQSLKHPRKILLQREYFDARILFREFSGPNPLDRLRQEPHGLVVCPAFQGVPARSGQVPDDPGVIAPGAGEVISQGMDRVVVHGCLSALQRFAGSLMELAGTGEPHLGVDDLPHQGMHELVYDVCSVGGLFDKLPCPELIQARQNVGLGLLGHSVEEPVVYPRAHHRQDVRDLSGRRAQLAETGGNHFGDRRREFQILHLPPQPSFVLQEELSRVHE